MHVSNVTEILVWSDLPVYENPIHKAEPSVLAWGWCCLSAEQVFLCLGARCLLHPFTNRSNHDFLTWYNSYSHQFACKSYLASSSTSSSSHVMASLSLSHTCTRSLTPIQYWMEFVRRPKPTVCLVSIFFSSFRRDNTDVNNQLQAESDSWQNPHVICWSLTNNIWRCIPWCCIFHIFSPSSSSISPMWPLIRSFSWNCQINTKFANYFFLGTKNLRLCKPFNNSMQCARGKGFVLLLWTSYVWVRKRVLTHLQSYPLFNEEWSLPS